MQIGIEAIGFSSSNYYLDMQDLAHERNIDVAKFYDGLGQKKMAVPPPGEDVVTLAANAASEVVTDSNKEQIELVLFATESGIDCSKSAGIYVHSLLGLPSRCRVLELKQACYSATAGLQLALAFLEKNPTKKVLLLASDIARYGLHTTGESSQGAGAVAILLAANPRLLSIKPEAGFYTKDVMDFWRPNYCDAAFVDGRYSCDVYIRVMEETWKQYTELSGRKFSDHDRFCYHTPVPKLVEKTHRRLAKLNGIKELSAPELQYQIGLSLLYNCEIGNCYTASLFVAVLSLLENATENLAGRLLGLYSYGSGCSGEFFAAEVMPDYEKMLNSAKHKTFLANRKRLSYAEYAEFYNFKLPEDGSELILPQYATGKFKLVSVKQHKRIYEPVL